MGHEVVVIDNRSSDAHEHFYINPNAEYRNLDISKLNWIRSSFQNVDVVFHLAAESRIMNCVEDPTLAVNTNTTGTCNVLQASKENNVKRFVYSSTSAAYGLNNDIPNTEDMPVDCLNPYSVSKIAGEELCRMYNNLYGLETVMFRYFNVYGERQPTKGQYAPVIGMFQKQHNEGKPMTVVGDGTNRRDYVNVSDVVEANILAANSTDPNILGQVFNLGSGINYSVLDLVRMIGGDDAQYEMLDPRPGEAKETLADCSKVYKYLHWTPHVKLEDWIEQQKEST